MSRKSSVFKLKVTLTVWTNEFPGMTLANWREHYRIVFVQLLRCPRFFGTDTSFSRRLIGFWYFLLDDALFSFTYPFPTALCAL